MVTPFQPRQPVRLIKALSEHLGRVVSAVRSDLYWRFAWPGRYRQRFEQAVTNMSHGICLYDANDRLQLVNEQFCRIYNQPMATLHIGMSFRDMLANSIAIGNYPGLTTDQVWHKRKTFIDQRQPGTFLQELGDGRLIAISHQPLPDGGWVATYEDITERRRAEMQIKFMAEHDALTQLPNRLLFGERLERELAGVKGGGSCCLICLDLDGFKPVNDRLGHAAGDMLLRQVADRLRMNVRVDDVPARLGGDEFAVLLPNTDAAEALAIATRIGAALRCEYDLGAYGPAAIGVSIGVACAPDHADVADLLLSHADTALYVAKHGSSPLPLLYDAQRPPHAANRRAEGTKQPGKADPGGEAGALHGAASAVSDLRFALQMGWLSLDYQPVCDCLTTSVVAYEALLRPNDPLCGSMLPLRLVSAAQDSDLVVSLSDWLLRQACTEAAGWDCRAQIGVNLSPPNFRQPDLVARVASILRETGLAPERLVIEVAGDLLLDQPVIEATMHEMRALGVELWMDNFGTGYANFASLRSGPFSAIKIDKSFLAAGRDGIAVLAATINFGKACHLKVVVDGVETAEQLDLLRTLGCDSVQGSLLSAPTMPCDIPMRKVS